MNNFIKTAFSFLMVGKTQKSATAGEGFKRYVGLGTSRVLAVNPTKAELEKIYGREIEKEPNYVIEQDGQKGVCVDIIVQTVPEDCNGIDMINHARFNLYPVKWSNSSGDKLRVIDDYGNAQWMRKEDAEAHKKCLTRDGSPQKLDDKYRICFRSEADIIDFLRKYLFNKDSFSMPNGTWVKKEDADDVLIGFEDPKKLLSGDVSEIRELIALQPNNKIKLLYGVRTTEDGKKYQAVCTSYDLMARNNVTANGLVRLEKDLVSAKNSGMYSNIDFRVQELQEWDVQPTNLEAAPEASSDVADEMPW